MNIQQKELEKILKELNLKINKWELNIERNWNIIETIINIYKEAKNWNTANVILLIEKIKIIFWVSNLPEYIDNDTRDWDFYEDDEEIACSDIESITAVFLKNLKKYNGSNQ